MSLQRDDDKGEDEDNADEGEDQINFETKSKCYPAFKLIAPSGYHSAFVIFDSILLLRVMIVPLSFVCICFK